MPVKIDIIILSYAKTDDLRETTEQGIRSLLASEEGSEITFGVLVIESNKSAKPYQYPNTRTVYPDTVFGYNKYMNMGIRETQNEYVCLSNNDLVYHKGWASAMLKAMADDPKMLSGSPYCTTYHKDEGFDENGPVMEGYFGVLGGWCIFVRRKIFDIIGPLDEKLLFWYCDADYCETLEKFHVKNCLVPASKVTHLGSESLKTVDGTEYKKLTQWPRIYYSYKWKHHSLLKYLLQSALYRIQSVTGR